MKPTTLIALSSIFAAMPALAQPQATLGSIRHVATANRVATFRPRPSGFIGGAQVYPWSEGTIYTAYTAPGMVTDIVLQHGESLIAVASGDTARWVIGDTTSGSGEAKQTHLLVKPFSDGLATNLVVTTDRRTYHVRLVSTLATALSSMRWTYPQDELLALRRKAETERAAAPVATGLSVDTLNFNYTIRGDKPGWRPMRAFDDGQRTYVEFPASLASSEAPPLFLVGRDGKAELVNYRLNGRFYVVDRIFDAAELRLGLKKQQIVRIDRFIPPAKRRGA